MEALQLTTLQKYITLKVRFTLLSYYHAKTKKENSTKAEKKISYNSPIYARWSLFWNDTCLKPSIQTTKFVE